MWSVEKQTIQYETVTNIYIFDPDVTSGIYISFSAGMDYTGRDQDGRYAALTNYPGNVYLVVDNTAGDKAGGVDEDFFAVVYDSQSQQG